MPKPEKVQMVQEIQERLSKVQGAVIADYRGLDVATITELRKQLAKQA